ncbi:hypothetical protein ABPG72_013233 [Tetrahymena utriculariae]
MNLDSVFEWILKQPINYPGKHQDSQPRTNPAYKPLEAKAQFHIIFKATGEYIREKMLDGKGVNMRDFGAFTFEIFSDTVKPAQHSNFDIAKDLNEQRADRKHVHRIRPCFVPDKKFRYSLARYAGKEEISAPKSQHSIYQKGFSMMFCNAGPIAASCYLGKDVVSSAHNAFIQAVSDLTTLGHGLNIDFGFVKVYVQDRDLRYSYNQNFANTLNNKNFEYRLRKSDTPTSEHWNTTYESKWAKSSLNTLLKRPNSNQVRNYYEKTLALKIMSLDLSTAEQTNYSRIKSKPQQLPPLKK